MATRIYSAIPDSSDGDMENNIHNHSIHNPQRWNSVLVRVMLSIFGSIVLFSMIAFVRENNSDTSILSGNDQISSLKVALSSNPPNVVFILADDLGYNSLDENVTPFMSGLKDKGVTMSNYYTLEVCTPSRASLLTGRYPLMMGWQYSEQVWNIVVVVVLGV